MGWSFETPDVYYDSSHVRIALKVVENLHGEIDVSAAYVSGSLAAGLGHQASDLDLYALAPRVVEPRHRELLMGSQRVDLEQVAEPEFERLLDLLTCYGTASPKSQPRDIAPDDLKRLVRLYTAQAIISLAHIEEARQGMSSSALRQLLTTHFSRLSAGSAEDSFGAVGSCDWGTAIHASESALRYSCEVALASVGDFYLGPKFLFRRLSRHQGLRSLVAAATPLLSVHISQDDDAWRVRQLVEQRLLLANGVLSYCVLEGWEASVDEVPAVTPAGVGPVRNPYCTLVRLNNAIGIHAPTDGFEIGVEAARLWSMLDGSPLTLVSERFAEWLGESTNDITKDVDDSIADMVASGVVVPSLGGLFTEGERG